MDNSFAPHIMRAATAPTALLKEILFPSACAACETLTSGIGGDDEFLCTRCFDAIDINTFLLCPACGRRVIFGPRGGIVDHDPCRKKLPYIAGAATGYDHPVIQKVLRRYKYPPYVRTLALPLSRLMIRYLENIGIDRLETYTVVPVPLHRAKERARGFNQSAQIAKHVALRLGLPFRESMLAKIFRTRSQADMDNWTARATNVRGCFAAPQAAAKKKNILLVDDVITSGATISEAVKALRGAGARRIIAVAVARARK